MKPALCPFIINNVAKCIPVIDACQEKETRKCRQEMLVEVALHKKSAFESAKPMTDNSPALQCWESEPKKSPVRETDG